jgi:hypothetical protein
MSAELMAQQGQTFERKTEVTVDSQQFFSVRNGQDFQNTSQADSQFYGFFSPKIKTEIKQLALHYDGEIGYDQWQASHSGNEVINRNHGMMIRNREIALALIKNQFSSKIGLQSFDDGTGLFLKHYGLGASFQFQQNAFQIQAFAAGLSSNTFEGLQLDQKSQQFTNQQHVLGLKMGLDLTRFKSHLSAIVYRDSALSIDLLNGHFDAQYESQSKNFVVYASIDLQWQKRRKQDWLIAGQSSQQWALQMGSRLKISQSLHLGMNAFAISGDGQNGFFYSGKNQSSTLMLTQDENRDRYDNLDERLARTQSSFFMNQLGYEVADLKLSYFWTDHLKSSLVFGIAQLQKTAEILTYQPTAVQSSSMVGSELSLVNRLKISDETAILLVLQGIVPNTAGAGGLINESDYHQNKLLFGAMIGVVSRF